MSVRPLTLLLLSACAGESEGDERADTLVIALASEPRDLLSVLYTAPVDGNVIANLNLPLFDTGFDCALKFKPAWAREWRFSEDGRTLHVELDPKVTWSDGTRATALDLRFTWELIADERVKSPRADLLSRVEGPPTVLDAATLEWHFRDAYDQTEMLAALAAVTAVPKHLLEGKNLDRGSLRDHPLDGQSVVGNGPWKMTSWERGQQMVLEPNEAFTGADELRPTLRSVVFKFLPDQADRVAALTAGSVDLVEGLLPTDADAVEEKRGDVQFHRRGWRSVDYVAWNNVDPADWKARSADAGARPLDSAPHPLFGDREVRRALAMAIDTDAMIRELLTSPVTGEVYGRPAVGTITPALCGAHNDAIRRLPFAAEDARARLGELGWADTNADGWLDKDGVPFRFTLLMNAGQTRRIQAAALIKEQLAVVGVDVLVEPIEPTPFFERLRARDFDAVLSSWSASMYPDPSPIWAEDAEFNLTSYRSLRVAELLAAGRGAADPAKADLVWKDLQSVIYEDQPYAFLYWVDEIVGIDMRFQNTRVDMLGGWRDLHRWSVPEGRVKYPE
jgi:peptide/nickel transport system substrate-binding protein